MNWFRDSDYAGPGTSEYAEQWDRIFAKKSPAIPYKTYSASIHVTPSEFTDRLREATQKAYESKVLAVVENISFYRGADYVEPRRTRWQRWRAKARNVFYRLRHSVCCSCGDDW